MLPVDSIHVVIGTWNIFTLHIDVLMCIVRWLDSSGNNRACKNKQTACSKRRKR